MTHTAADEWELARLMEGFLTTQLLYVAAKLDLAGMLADGARTGADLARAVGAEPVALTRVLRGLAVEGVLDERDDGRFGLTPVGDALRTLEGAIVARA